MISTEQAIAKASAKSADATTAPAPRAETSLLHRQSSDGQTVVHVDLDALRAAGLLPEAAQERRMAEQFRAIKRTVLQKLRAVTATQKPIDGANMLLVTSALPGDGKSFTAVNLAFSIAREHDVSLVLLDADVVKRHVSRAFGLESTHGLLDALADASIDVEACIRRTSVPGLSVLPVGTAHEHAAELLSSTRMRAILSRIGRDSSRLLLADSMPLLLSSDAVVLAQMARQIVLVVRSGVTPQGAVQEAISQINKDKLAGLVLNENDMPSFNQYYGYGMYGVT